MIALVKVEERTWGLDARKMKVFQLNTKKSKSIKCDNNKQQKNTQLVAAGRNELGEHSATCYTKRVRQPFPPPPPLILFIPFWTEKVPLL